MGWRIPITDLAAELDEFPEVRAAVEQAVLGVVRSGEYVLGPETRAFEAEMANLVGVRFAVGVGSGTEAVSLALRALGVGPGDEVITTPFTFFATAGAILLAGATPVFADIEADGFNLSPDGLDAVCTARTRAVVPVHLFGRCADVDAIGEWASHRGVAVVEDAAQSIGAGRGGRRAGACGDAGCFSFYPSKNLGALGDAGCVTTDDSEVAERLRMLRTHGAGTDGINRLAGTTSRLDSIQAAALRAKLPYLKQWNDGRARNARLYAEHLGDCENVRLPEPAVDEEVVWSQYTIRCRSRDRVRDALASHGVESRVYYPMPAYRQPALGAARRPAGSCPEAEKACDEVLSLPVRGSCSADEIRFVADVVRRSA